MEPILQERVNIARKYEVHCYRVCYYLLQDEQQATKAVQEVMTRLIKDDNFNNRSDLSIEQYIKKESMKESLHLIYSKE
ncbi:MAG: hypothetical protein WD424_02400 [Paenibacillaceae bacterium]